jgi:hypothetical protein
MVAHDRCTQKSKEELTADDGSSAAGMAMPPTGTRRPQTPAATGPTMMKDEKLVAAVIEVCVYVFELDGLKCCQSWRCRTSRRSAEICWS